MRRGLRHLEEVGWATTDSDGRVELSGNFRSYLNDDRQARVDGINNNDYQLGKLARYNQAAHLDHLCRGIKGDFMQLPLASASYDELGESWTSTSEFRVRTG